MFQISSWPIAQIGISFWNNGKIWLEEEAHNKVEKWEAISLLKLETSANKPLFPLLILQDEKIILKTETACFYPRENPLQE